jgi:hypothetical protein
MGLVISKGLTLKSYNTPAAIAGVAPTLDYRFALDRREIEAISLTDKLTYTGATNGTFVNRAGLIERATTDQPRFDHGPASRQSLGLLVEEQRTNSVVRSEEFDNASWIAQNSTIDPNVEVAPNGTLTADKQTHTGSGPRISRFSAATIPASSSFTFSFYAKAGTSSYAAVSVYDGTTTGKRFWFNLITGLPGGITNIGLGYSLATSSMQNVGNGWYRCIAAMTNGSNTTVNIDGISVCLDQNGLLTPSVSGLYGYIWGAQLEVGSSPTSYIPTTTTALTRPVDSAVIDGTGVITGTYTLVEKPAGCAVVNGTNIDLVSGFTAERVMVFPAALSAPQITAIRGAM